MVGAWSVRWGLVWFELGAPVAAPWHWLWWGQPGRGDSILDPTVYGTPSWLAAVNLGSCILEGDSPEVQPTAYSGIFPDYPQCG